MSHLIRNSRFSTQLVVITVMAVLAMVCISVANAYMLKQSLLSERKELTHSALELADQVLKTEVIQAERDGLDQEATQQRVIEQIKALRFGENSTEYYWINDMDAVVVMNPMTPALEGRNLYDAKDVTGHYFMRSLLDMIERDAEGYFQYYWPKPGGEEPLRKLAFVKGYEPWGWVIGSGVYLDDIDTAFYKRLMMSTAILSASALLMVFFASMVLRRIQQPDLYPLSVASLGEVLKLPPHKPPPPQRALKTSVLRLTTSPRRLSR